MDDDAGALLIDWRQEIESARAELRLAAERETRDQLDDLVSRIVRARAATRPGTFFRQDWDRLLDRALESRRRHFG